jgi:hypothetical protein
MATFYDTPENEGEFCKLDGGELEIDETSVPKFALVPSKIAADALEEGHTPWEVYDALVDSEEGKPEEVKDLLKPCKDWALAAALRGDNGAETSKNGVHIGANLWSAGPSGKGHESMFEWHPWDARAGKTQGRAAVVLGIKREGHRPRGNPVSGGYQAAKQCGGRLPRWSVDGHAHDERAGVGPAPQALLKRHKRKVDGVMHGHQMVQHATNLD